MFKSVFSKYFVSISAIIMSSFLVMTTIQVLLFTRSVAQDKRTLLTENAGNIARHTAISAVESQTQGSGGVIYRLDQAGMNQFLTMMSDAIDASIFVTDDNGRVLSQSPARGSQVAPTEQVVLTVGVFSGGGGGGSSSSPDASSSPGGN